MLVSDNGSTIGNLLALKKLFSILVNEISTRKLQILTPKTGIIHNGMVQILEFWFEEWGQRLGEDLEQAL